MKLHRPIRTVQNGARNWVDEKEWIKVGELDEASDAAEPEKVTDEALE